MAADSPLLLAVDLGTASAKVGLFQPDGRLVAFARQPFATPAPDPEAWWAAVRDGLRVALDGQDSRRVQAVCVGGQGPSLVLVDAQGRTLGPALSWMDRRPEALSADLAARLGVARLAYSLVPRLAWLAAHEPARLERARWALQAWDFIACRLAGGEVGVASTFAGDVVWPPDWLAAAGLGGDPRVPPAVAAGQAYAVTAGPWAAEAGLPEGIPVVGGVNDGIGSIVGAAGALPGRAIDPGGSAGGLALCWHEPLVAPGVDCWPGLAPGTSIVGGALAAGGRALEWWVATAGLPDAAAAIDLAAQAPPGAEGVVFLPFLEGERAPLWDSRVRGAFLGLGFGHGAPHLARAVLESSALALRRLAEPILAAGGRLDEVRLCGRQAGSRLWNRVKVDATGLPAAVPEVVEVALMASAIYAALGAGHYRDVLEAGEAMVRVAERLTPDPALAELYAVRYATYRAGYEALRALPGATA